MADICPVEALERALEAVRDHAPLPDRAGAVVASLADLIVQACYRPTPDLARGLELLAGLVRE